MESVDNQKNQKLMGRRDAMAMVDELPAILFEMVVGAGDGVTVADSREIQEGSGCYHPSSGNRDR